MTAADDGAGTSATRLTPVVANVLTTDDADNVVLLPVINVDDDNDDDGSRGTIVTL